MHLYINRTEHKQHHPNCPFLKIKDPYSITFGDVLELEKAAMENYIVRLIVKIYYNNNSSVNVYMYIIASLQNFALCSIENGGRQTRGRPTRSRGRNERTTHRSRQTIKT